MTRSFFTIDEETNEDKTVLSSLISVDIMGIQDIELGHSGYFGGDNNHNSVSYSQIHKADSQRDLFEAEAELDLPQLRKKAIRK